MSKFKTPREKKMASLLHDHRNVYRENDKSSRKNIPLSKKQSQRAARRAANVPLASLVGQIDEDTATRAESRSRSKFTERRGEGFRKYPDAPLGALLEAGQTGQWAKTHLLNWLGKASPKSE